MKFLWYVIAIALCSEVYGQCQNGQCYAPGWSTRTTGKVVRRWRIEKDGTRTLLFDASKGGEVEKSEPVTKTPTKSPKQTTGAASKLPTQTSGLMPGEINRDSRAYAHAKKEAQMLANSGNGGWHPLGTAPGCRYSGCGMSSNGVPNHCYRNLGDHRVIARACVYRNGRYFWSAHLR